MGVLVSLLAVAALILIGSLGAQAPYIFGVIIPYIAIAAFIIGIIVRIVKWASSPVPFRITTTCGQQKSLSFIRQNKLDSPFTRFQVFLRMALEVMTFRSLFRNTTADIKDGPKLTYTANKWLWLFSIIFHYSFLVVVLRHFRIFTEPAPWFVAPIEVLDGFFQVGVPIIFLTTAGITVGVLYLLARRFFDGQVRYISLSSDYFPLLLILSIAVTGIMMRHFTKVDLVPVKEMVSGLFAFAPIVPEGVGVLAFIHLFLVCALLAYFPMSKLVHAPGVFMSPTRVLPNNNRAERHVNPWNPDVEVHTYEEYEEEFRDLMKSVDLPLEKEEGENVK